jgi:hypothetical protein
VFDCKLGDRGCWTDGKCRYTKSCENQIINAATEDMSAETKKEGLDG